MKVIDEMGIIAVTRAPLLKEEQEHASLLKVTFRFPWLSVGA